MWSFDVLLPVLMLPQSPDPLALLAQSLQGPQQLNPDFKLTDAKCRKWFEEGKPHLRPEVLVSQLKKGKGDAWSDDILARPVSWPPLDVVRTRRSADPPQAR